MNLYEISNELAFILSEEELDEGAEARLGELEMALEMKVEGVLQARQGILAEVEAIKAEADRLKARADSMTRRAEWLKKYVLSAMERSGVGRVSTLTFSASVCTSPPKVELAEGEEIPFEYAKEETKVLFDKAKALADYKAGKPLPFGVNVTQGSHLKIS